MNRFFCALFSFILAILILGIVPLIVYVGGLAILIGGVVGAGIVLLVATWINLYDGCQAYWKHRKRSK